MASSQRTQVLSLYRRLLKESSQFDSYNFRAYALRRVRDAFRANVAVTDPKTIDRLIKDGQSNLALIKRQVTIGKMYPSNHLVIENK